MKSTTQPKQATSVKAIYSPEGIATPFAFQWPTTSGTTSTAHLNASPAVA
ncbi:MAG: hypothetical protein WCP79_15055 [Bacillota bacterium]